MESNDSQSQDALLNERVRDQTYKTEPCKDFISISIGLVQLCAQRLHKKTGEPGHLLVGSGSASKLLSSGKTYEPSHLLSSWVGFCQHLAFQRQGPASAACAAPQHDHPFQAQTSAPGLAQRQLRALAKTK